MPTPVNINTLKEWFSNLKKPPQEQFWAWLDSFRHKWEKVPLDDVEGLRGILNKKADLVNGVVPEEQLPFSVVTSEVIALGAVSVNSKINLAVHSSGANKVRVKGRMIIRSFPNQWDFTAFVGSGIKVIRGYAVKSEDDFFISEGDELPTYTEPQIPENALEIFKITISVNGIVIDESSQYGSKMKADDQWTNAYLDIEEGDYLSIENQPSSFNLVISPAIMNPKLFGVMTVRVFSDDNNFSWDGKEFLLYAERDVLLTSQESNPVAALPFVDDTNYIAKAGTYTRLKLRDNKVVVLPGGGANFPEGGNIADVLVKTVDGEVWSDRLTNAESEIDTEIVNRAQADNNLRIELQNNINAEALARAAADALKLDKPLNDGSWVITKAGSTITFTSASSFGQNISNADLTNVSARVFTQANTFTWNTQGIAHYLKGLVDRTGNAAYTKVVVVHPTTGEKVTRDFADPQATTLAVQNANATQKAAMRTALLGTATPANPTLQDVAPRFVTRGLVYIDLLGLNLILLAPVFIWIEKLDGTKIYATNFYNISNTVVTTQWDLPLDLPLGDYTIQIQNGVTTQGLSTAKFTVSNSVTDLILLASAWKRKSRLLSNGNEAPVAGQNISSDNFTRVDNFGISGFDGSVDSVPAIIYKSENIFPGDKDFDIDINMTLLSSSGAISPDFTPFIGLTETSHANFTNILNIVNNTFILEGVRGMRLTANSPNFDMSNIITKIYISKVGNKVNWRISNNNQSSFMYKQETIDTTKNYALFFRGSAHSNNSFARLESFITLARILN